ncbi:MAG: hypothetical protein K2O70_00110 [Desulfovibrionaceae bacterium]|nr:hypothetical protein [Desulfovibrionaceae bacterium]
MGLLGTLAKTAGGLLTRKITETAPDAARTTRRATRRFTRWAGYVLTAALIYHFLLWPVLNHHFPEYGFPPLGLELLTGLFAAGL